MPTILTHGVVAAGLATVAPFPRRSPLFWSLSIGLAMLPDLDVVAFSASVPPDSLWSHRGVSHSLVMAAAVGVVAAALTHRRWSTRFWPLAVYFFTVMASHGTLDAFTNGGDGIMFSRPSTRRGTSFPGVR